jgi:hypothetical protein
MAMPSIKTLEIMLKSSQTHNGLRFGVRPLVHLHEFAHVDVRDHGGNRET